MDFYLEKIVDDENIDLLKLGSILVKKYILYKNKARRIDIIFENVVIIKNNNFQKKELARLKLEREIIINKIKKLDKFSNNLGIKVYEVKQ
jgi:hypothetical protein